MHTFPACLLISCVAAGACGFKAVDGSGKVVVEPRPVSAFSSVVLSGTGRVVIEQTGMESLTVTTDDNLLQYITTEVRGNALELGTTNSMTSLRPTNDIVYTLQVKQLDGLVISGSGSVAAKGLNPEQLRIEISGSGAVSAQGTAGDLDLTITGSGAYEGEQMKSNRVTVTVTGSGGAVVAASETLIVDVRGSGSVEYVGEPKLTQQLSGSGSVRKR